MVLHVQGVQEKTKAVPLAGSFITDPEETKAGQTKQHILYARVSSLKQKPDLERQVAALQSAFPGRAVVTDIASGINWQRQGLNTLLERASKGDLGSITVAHRDRLCRFAYELLEHVFKLFSVEIHVVHAPATADDATSEQQELAEDLMAINTVFICRQQGRRAAAARRAKRKSIQETSLHNQTSSHQEQETEDDAR